MYLIIGNQRFMKLMQIWTIHVNLVVLIFVSVNFCVIIEVEH